MNSKQAHLSMRLPILATMDTSAKSTHSEHADFYKAMQARKAILAEYRKNIFKLIKDEDRCASLLCMLCCANGRWSA